MFLRSTTLIYPNLYLISLGGTCRYAIVSDDGAITLTDPGASLHVPALIERITRLGFEPRNIRNILLTHLDADRISAVALLRRVAPSLKVYGIAAMQRALTASGFLETLWSADQEFGGTLFGDSSKPEVSVEEYSRALTIDRPLVEADSIELGDELTIRSMAIPGHREHSVCYMLVPHEFVIADETLGYFRGSRFAAPGADYNLSKALNSLAQFEHLEISGIGFPYGGAITGALARKHLTSLAQNSKDIVAEYKRAVAEGVSLNEICEQIRESFYTPTIQDPFFIESLTQSYQRLLAQLPSAT
jgi:glyoxylase-like metal-dependent hydrolase (beta-lactamase superfamily II)